MKSVRLMNGDMECIESMHGVYMKQQTKQVHTLCESITEAALFVHTGLGYNLTKHVLIW